MAAFRGDEMRVLWGISDLGRAIRRQLRFGELSRSPLQLLRLEWRGDVAECDWLARPADVWDQDLPPNSGDKHFAEQALRDAIAMRELLFDALPGVDAASLRAFRQSAGGALDLIVLGTVNRGDKVSRKVSSTAMRAKLLGFQFWLQDGILEALPSEECAMSF
jgi:hypothetical protein